MLISVVIPTLNEAARLPACLAGLTSSPVPHEIIVVDGGSTDSTVELAREKGVRVLHCDPGRGRQLALGAEWAQGDVIWFLHADTRVAAGDALSALAAAFGQSDRIEGGNFRLFFDGDNPFCTWLTGFYAWIRSHGWYYGDSGIFVRRDILKEIGGVRPLALMEDYDLVRRLERRTRTVLLQDPALITSGRRFVGRSKPAIIAGWLAIHLLFHLGLSPELLARLYNSARRGEERQGTAAFRSQS